MRCYYAAKLPAFELAREQYGTEDEFLWARTPNFDVLRHPNGKWYAVVMDIPGSKLGLHGDDLIDVMKEKTMILTTVCPDDLRQYKLDMQEAFQMGAVMRASLSCRKATLTVL